MSEVGSTSESSGITVAAPAPQRSASPVRVAVVFLLLAVIVAAVGWTGYVWWNSKDGKVSWKSLTLQDRPPELVEVTGQVLYKGRPVTQGSVVTEFSRKGLFGGLSVLDKDGRFRLRTQVDGTYHDGVYVGTHTVAIFAYADSPGAGQPRGLVPKKYLMHSTSPLRMVVTSDPGKNVFTFRLTGDLESGGRRGAGGRGGRGPGRGGSGAPSADQIISGILARDENKDGKISRDEAPDRLKQSFDRADKNSDGFIDKAELKTLVESFRRGRKPRKRPRPAAPPKTREPETSSE
ncbi:MAG: hypothetical protein ACE5KM_14585 [Planctomycetaceae bacterium]